MTDDPMLRLAEALRPFLPDTMGDELWHDLILTMRIRMDDYGAVWLDSLSASAPPPPQEPGTENGGKT